MKAYVGTIVHATSVNHLEILDPGLIVYDQDGRITSLEPLSNDSPVMDQVRKRYPTLDTSKVTQLERPHQFLMPGFVDTHIHAPQYVFTGTGYDVPLLEWLKKYTFPREAEFASVDHAKDAYHKCVDRTIKEGTTTACYYATLHLPASKVLVDVVYSLGQRAFVGKVNMDANSPDFYVETTSQSEQDTVTFVEYCLAKGKLVTPVLTPRFAPSCSAKLMTALANIAKQHALPIQSHISENMGEISWVKELFPECLDYADVYDKMGLLTPTTIMAHGIYLTPKERQLFKDRQVGVSHCPLSNFCLQSGVLNVRRLLRQGIKVGLGTDVAGGYAPNMLEVMRGAMAASKVTYMHSMGYMEGSAAPEQTSDPIQKAPFEPLALAEVVYLATLGGAQVMGLDTDIGNFVAKKHFDALVVDVRGTVDVFSHDTVASVFEKWVYLGNASNIKRVHVGGHLVHESGLASVTESLI